MNDGKGLTEGPEGEEREKMEKRSQRYLCHSDQSPREAAGGNTEAEVQTITYKMNYRASLVAQWLRVCLPMQGTRV